ncbi:MAG: DUF2493 domain-containing protein [Deltaproteobacteria bacterium]|nr:DUF2493 domain-containing protein [Deltaproteobacteria bacterium]
MKIIIAGSRKFKDYEYLKKKCVDIISELQYAWEVPSTDIEIISRHTDGADKLGEMFAEEFGLKVVLFPADWKDMSPPVMIGTNAFGQYNILAGKNRNQKMLDYAGMDGVTIGFVFGESKGTKDMIKISKKAGIPTFRIDTQKDLTKRFN